MKKPIIRPFCIALFLCVFCTVFGQKTNILMDLGVCLNPLDKEIRLLDSNEAEYYFSM